MEEPKVEEVHEHDHDHEHEHDHDHEHEHINPIAPSKPKIGRIEKKARKILVTPDMEEIPNIMRATFKRDEKIYFFVDRPTVYKCKNQHCYIVFGTIRIDNTDRNSLLQQAANEKFQAPEEAPEEAPAEAPEAAAPAEAAPAEAAPAEEVDETGINPDDIAFVIEQTKCSRAQAVKALRENDNDMINAIMALGN